MVNAHLRVVSVTDVITLTPEDTKVDRDQQSTVGNELIQGWRDDSAVNGTGYSSRGPRFNSQYPHGNSQPSVTPGSDTLT